ncbi:MAG: nitrogenase stabilizing/protective protein NifW [Hyphomicrobium sp.]
MEDHSSCSIGPVIPLAYEKDALGQLKAYSSAEDFFVGLGLPFDPAVVSVARLHILKRMGEYLAGDDLEGLPNRVVIARCRSYLERAYQDFVNSGPLQQRVFKVLKDAVAPRPENSFVSIDELE